MPNGNESGQRSLSGAKTGQASSRVRQRRLLANLASTGARRTGARRSAAESLRRAAFLGWAGLRAASDFGPKTTARIVAATLRDAGALAKTRLVDQRAAMRVSDDTALTLPGLLRDARKQSDGALFTFEHASLEAIFLAPDSLRLTWAPGREPSGYALVDGHGDAEGRAGTLAGVELIARAGERGGEGLVSWLLRSETLEVVVYGDGALEVVRRGGPILRRYLPPRRRGASWEERFEVRRAEHLLGLGEQAAGIDLFGRRFRLWNKDPGGSWGPGRYSLYMGIPVLVGAHPEGCLLAFYENSTEAWMDFTGLSESPAARGVASARFASGVLRVYLFAGSLPQVLRGYVGLTGSPALPPRWAFGYHQSRWGYKDEAIVREVARGFADMGLPLSAVHLDIDYMDGYRVFTIDRVRFPDMAGLCRDLLAEQGTRVVTILDPGVKVDRSSELYLDGLERGVFCTGQDGSVATGLVWPGKAAFPDFTSEATRRWWGERYRVLMDAGVSGIWHDMNEPTTLSLVGDKTLPRSVMHSFEGRGGDHAEAHNVYGLLMNSAGFEGLRALKPANRPFIVSRSGWAGTQRYAWNWTGDTESSWATLRQQVATLVGLGMSGVPYSGPDVGGFSGAPDGELYLRWLELAAFLPFCRTHSVVGAPAREPWMWSEPYRSLVASWIRFRYRLLPYLYSLAAMCAKDGTPLVRPVAWPHPASEDDQLEPELHEALFEVDDAFLLGDCLLVAPVLSSGATSRRVLLPPGSWRSIWANDATSASGGEELVAPAPLGRPVVLARAGSILPLDDGWAEPDSTCAIDRDAVVIEEPPSTLDPSHAPRLLSFHVWPDSAGFAAGYAYDDAGDGYGEGRNDRLELRRADSTSGHSRPDGLVFTWSRSGSFPPPARVRVVLHGEMDTSFRHASTAEGEEMVVEGGAFESGSFTIARLW